MKVLALNNFSLEIFGTDSMNRKSRTNLIFILTGSIWDENIETKDKCM